MCLQDLRIQRDVTVSVVAVVADDAGRARMPDVRRAVFVTAYSGEGAPTAYAIGPGGVPILIPYDTTFQGASEGTSSFNAGILKAWPTGSVYLQTLALDTVYFAIYNYSADVDLAVSSIPL